jgi:protein-S-isoprenylcysteine O-methyltransferase Ste14
MHRIQPIELAGAAWAVFASYWVVQGIRAKRAAVREPLGDRVAHLAMMAAAAYLLASDDPRLGKLNERFLPDAPWIGLLGVALTFAGVAFAIWARHHIGLYWSARVSIVTEHKLIRTGPYAHIRHPIYTGILLGLAGTALVAGSTALWSAWPWLCTVSRGRRRRRKPSWRRSLGLTSTSIAGIRVSSCRNSIESKRLR